MKTLEIVEKVADLYQEKISGYKLEQAIVSFIMLHDGEISIMEASRHADIYEAMELASNLITPIDTIGMSVDTTGWAAPLGADGQIEGMPSKHPEKRRVRLNAIATDNGTASAIAFEATAERLLDDGEAIGSLSTALAFAWITASTKGQ